MIRASGQPLPSFDNTEWIIYWVANGLSALGCLAVFYGGYRSKGNINISLRFVLLLSLSDFIVSLLNLISPALSLDNEKCHIIGFIKVFAGWTGLFWTSAISLLAFMIIGDFSRLDLNKTFTKIVIISLLASILIAGLPLLKAGGLIYTVEEYYCGVSYAEGATFWEKILVFTVSRGTPYVIAVLLTLAAYLRTLLFLRRLPRELVEAYGICGKKLLLYPAAQLVIYTPTALSTLFLIWMPKIPKTLFVIGTTCYNLSGFINFLVYGGMLLQNDRKNSYDRTTVLVDHNSSDLESPISG